MTAWNRRSGSKSSWITSPWTTRDASLDNSLDKGKPNDIRVVDCVGSGELDSCTVIPGFDEGLLTMKSGGFVGCTSRANPRSRRALSVGARVGPRLRQGASSSSTRTSCTFRALTDFINENNKFFITINVARVYLNSPRRASTPRPRRRVSTKSCVRIARRRSLDVAERRVRLYDTVVAQVLQRHRVSRFAQTVEVSLAEGQRAKVSVDDAE